MLETTLYNAIHRCYSIQLWEKKIPDSNYEIARMQYNQAIIGVLLFMQCLVRKQYISVNTTNEFKSRIIITTKSLSNHLLLWRISHLI